MRVQFNKEGGFSNIFNSAGMSEEQQQQICIMLTEMVHSGEYEIVDIIEYLSNEYEISDGGGPGKGWRKLTETELCAVVFTLSMYNYRLVSGTDYAQEMLQAVGTAFKKHIGGIRPGSKDWDESDKKAMLHLKGEL
jgi:hypothetical protein